MVWRMRGMGAWTTNCKTGGVDLIPPGCDIVRVALFALCVVVCGYAGSARSDFSLSLRVRVRAG
eukprot:scaffold12476_cov126-Isochrysis_galbana.AAC.7